MANTSLDDNAKKIVSRLLGAARASVKTNQHNPYTFDEIHAVLVKDVEALLDGSLQKP